MADTTNVRIFGSKEVQPVNKIIKVSRFQREENKDDGYESFASVLEKEMARKKTEGKKEATVEELSQLLPKEIATELYNKLH